MQERNFINYYWQPKFAAELLKTTKTNDGRRKLDE